MDRMITLALALTSQEWNRLGLDEVNDVNPYTQPTNDKGVIVERITALLLVRCVVLAVRNSADGGDDDNGNANTGTDGGGTCGALRNLLTSTACQQLLDRSVPFPSAVITEGFVWELQEYVRRMVDCYKDVPYHNREHVFHVVLSVNKLADMMVSGKNHVATEQEQKPTDNGDGKGSQPGSKQSTTTAAAAAAPAGPAERLGCSRKLFHLFTVFLHFDIDKETKQ
jgi:hypothetical protein